MQVAKLLIEMEFEAAAIESSEFLKVWWTDFHHHILVQKTFRKANQLVLIYQAFVIDCLKRLHIAEILGLILNERSSWEQNLNVDKVVLDGKLFYIL